MADHGITCSMSRSGNVWDDAAMESLSSLETERTARKVYRTRDDVGADVFDYIERFYNPRRRHSTLGELSPAEVEEKATLAYPGVRKIGSRPPRLLLSVRILERRRLPRAVERLLLGPIKSHDHEEWP